MIFDCFTFFNELDVLELRLQLLDDVVDRFVLCEAPFTFRGNPKPLTFAQHADRFARWRERIVHLVYPQPLDPNPWVNEWGQRAYLSAGLGDCAPDDIVWIGDVDEFPDPRLARERPAPGRVLAFRMLGCVGYVNRVTEEPWIGTRAVAYGDVPGIGTLNDVRLLPLAQIDTIDGGWHFSALGGAESMFGKLKAYSHAEYDVPYFTDRQRLEAEFGSEIGVRWIPLDERLPAALHEPRWAPFVWDKPSAEREEVERRMHVHGCFGYLPANARTIAALSAEPALWKAVGTARYGTHFVGAAVDPSDLPERFGSHDWVVIDGLERYDAAQLAALRARGAQVVAYAGNARSYVAIERVLAGEPFPPGQALGPEEARALVEGAGFQVAGAERVISRQIFAPLMAFPAIGTFVAKLGPYALHDVTREELGDFVSGATVFTLLPSAADTKGT